MITEGAGVQEELHAAHNMRTAIVRDQAIRTAAWEARNAVTGPCVAEYDPPAGHIGSATMPTTIPNAISP